MLFAHISGGVKLKAGFLSRMEMDFSLTLQIKLTDHVAKQNVDLQTKAKATYVSLCKIAEIQKFFK